MKRTLILSITIIVSVLTLGLLSNPFVSSSNISLINKVFAQEPEPEPEEVFIAPGASNPDNDDRFVPPEISVSASEENNIVSWRNDDSIEHTVTADDNSFDSGPISPGDTFDNVFDRPGDFGYHCSIHPFMTGVIVVE